MERKRLVTGFGEYLQRGGDGTELPTIQLKNRTYPLINIFNLTHSPIFFSFVRGISTVYISPIFAVVVRISEDIPEMRLIDHPVGCFDIVAQAASRLRTR